MSRKCPEELAPALAKTGQKWPEADEESLRQAAHVWREFGSEVERLAKRGNDSAQRVTGENKGKSVDAFADHWRDYAGGGRGHLDDAQGATEAVAKAFEAAATATDSCKSGIVTALTELAAAMKKDEAKKAAAAKQADSGTGINAVVNKVVGVVKEAVDEVEELAAVETAKHKICELLDHLADELKHAMGQALKEPAVVGLGRLGGVRSTVLDSVRVDLAGTAVDGVLVNRAGHKVAEVQGLNVVQRGNDFVVLDDNGRKVKGVSVETLSDGEQVVIDKQGQPVVGVALDKHGKVAMDHGQPILVNQDGSVGNTGLSVQLSDQGTLQHGQDGVPTQIYDKHGDPVAPPANNQTSVLSTVTEPVDNVLGGDERHGNGSHHGGIYHGDSYGNGQYGNGQGSDQYGNTYNQDQQGDRYDQGNQGQGWGRHDHRGAVPVSYEPPGDQGYDDSSDRVVLPPAAGHLRTDSFLPPPVVSDPLDPVFGGGGGGGGGTFDPWQPGGGGDNNSGGGGWHQPSPIGGGGGGGGFTPVSPVSPVSGGGGGGFTPVSAPVSGAPVSAPISGGPIGTPVTPVAGAPVVPVTGPVGGGLGGGPSGGGPVGGPVGGGPVGGGLGTAPGTPAGGVVGAPGTPGGAVVGVVGPGHTASGTPAAPGSAARTPVGPVAPGQPGTHQTPAAPGRLPDQGWDLKRREAASFGDAQLTAALVQPGQPGQVALFLLAQQHGKAGIARLAEHVHLLPTMADSRPYGLPGGLGPVDPAHQAELVRRLPHKADGVPVPHPDPRAGDWTEAVNGGGYHETGRGNNCVDISLSAIDSYAGRPTCAAPRLPDGPAGERGGRDRAERELGTQFRDLGDGTGALDKLAEVLRRSGPGAQAMLLTVDEYGRSHSWNAVNHGQQLTYLDHLTGRQSSRPLHGAEHGLWAIAVDQDCRPIDFDGDQLPLPAPAVMAPAEPAAAASSPTAPPRSSDR